MRRIFDEYGNVIIASIIFIYIIGMICNLELINPKIEQINETCAYVINISPVSYVSNE